MRKAALVFILLFLMLEILIIAPKEIGVSSNPETPLLNQNETSSAQQSMRGVHLLEAKQEKREWELWADQAFTSESGETWQLDNVKVIFFGESNTEYVVTGKTGTVNVKSKDIFVKGDVQMNSSNGYRFKTPQIQYLAENRIISTKDDVTMDGGRGKGEHPIELSGIGLNASMQTNEMEIQSHVRSKKQLENLDWVYIESEKALFNAQDRFAKYIGDVTVDYKGSRITGPSARFDYDSNIKAVNSMMIEGGGRVTDLTKWATAKTIQMLFQENKFILRGAPRVIQDNDELVGEEITFYDGGKEIEVSKGRANFVPRSEDAK